MRWTWSLRYTSLSTWRQSKPEHNKPATTTAELLEPWTADTTESSWTELHPHLKCFTSHASALQKLSCLWLCYRDPVLLVSTRPRPQMNQSALLAAGDNTLILWPGECLKCFFRLELTPIVSDDIQHQCSFPTDVVGWFTILNGGCIT